LSGVEDYAMHRVEVRLKSHLADARGLGLARDIHDLGITTVSNVRIVDVYWLDADLAPDKLDLICRRLLSDPVTQEYRYEPGSSVEGEVSTGYHTVEVAYNAGVTDPVEDTVMKAVRDLGVKGVRAVKTAKRYLIEGQLDENQLESICNKLLVNPIIQHMVESEQFALAENPRYRFKLNQIDISGLSEAGLLEIGQQFGFADDELRAIVGHFQEQGRNPTDIELETLAQTWSEHCVHKTFMGRGIPGSY